MVKSARPSPSLLPATLALIVLVVLGYLLFNDFNPSRTEHMVNPPIEIIDQQPALTVIPETDPAEPINEAEAKSFVDNLAEQPKDNESAITVEENKDVFVRHDSKLTLPNVEQRETTFGELLQDDSLSDDTPIILQYETVTETATTLNELQSQIEDQYAPISIRTAEGKVINKPLADILRDNSLDPNAPITLISRKSHRIDMTFGELSQLDLAADQPVKAIIQQDEQEIAVKDIVTEAMPADALYYLHRVSAADKQGLWGIIQSGLINKFREGLIIDGIARNRESVQVTIPADADEKLPSGLSSFLGKILTSKVNSSYVYNFKQHKMEDGPDRIYPGQQLILIHFTPQELRDIYIFFAKHRQQNAESFAISP
jgi:hypothetical protein